MDRSFDQAVFFDLDHTLISKNCGFLFGKFLYKNKKIPLSKMLSLIMTYCLCKIGFYSLEQIHHYAFESFFRNMHLHEMENLSDKFIDQNFESLKNIKLIPIFESLKKNHLVVILSSSPDFLVQRFAQKFGAHDFCGTTYLYCDHRFSNVDTIFEGSLKADFVRKISTSFSIEKKNLSAYSDSHLDIPFLESVGNPVAVNPTRLLRKHSLLKSWKIIE